MMARAVVMFIKIVTAHVIITSRILRFGDCESDTLKSSQAISVGQTLTSTNQKFELGFFSPANSSTRYIGVWFKNIPETILWVANRDDPLSASDGSARLALTQDGNLRILDGNQRTVWCANVSVHLNNSIAVISDSGDLVLKDSISGLVAWESFDHFCDVFLMTMHSGLNKRMRSWRSEVDPAVGNFTVQLLPQSPVQWVILYGKDIVYYRSGPWNGLKFLGSAETDVGYLEGWSIKQNIGTETVDFSANQYITNIIRIVKIFPGGSMKMMDWVGNKWSIVWEAPRTQCDVYGTCGKFGVCNANKSPICSCPRGFVPKSVDEWSRGNWSNGCVRRTQLLCSKNMTLGIERNDGFLKLSRMKVADNYQYLPSVDSQGCQEWCLNNCLCTAYTYIYAIGCLVWKGDLVDMQEFSFSGENIFVRLDQSELVKSKRVIIIIFLVSALCFIICFLIAFVVHKVRIRQQKQREGISKKFDLGSSSDVQQLLHWKTILQDELTTFDFEDIVTATNGFSHSNKVGEGGFGAVFRGKLHDGQEIAVKRLSDHSGQGINEFINEILLISKLQHRNLVKILGCSIEGEEKLIIYEYLPNGSLDTFLLDSSKKIKLDWSTRFNIIQAIARGISYLHRDSRLKVIHRDLKASNVLLDDDMNPKISDFGLARTFQATQESANTRRVVGTYGYMSPEYALRGIFSEKSDVFSFGILILEIIRGKKISSFDICDEPLGLLGYAWKLWNEGRELELIDESLQNLHSIVQIARCINVALLCVQDRPDDRPTMPTVILLLSSDMLIPQPKQPLYFPETRSSYICHPDEVNKLYSANEVTDSLFEGR